MQMNQKGNDAMQTPPHLYEELNAVFNFTVDAACETHNMLAPSGFCHDEGIDALKQSWRNERVFCNPPFSKKDPWMRKAHEEVQFGGCPIVIMVLPTNSMAQSFWHKWVYGKYFYSILAGRVDFIDPKTGLPATNNNSGTTIVYFMKLPNAKIPE